MEVVSLDTTKLEIQIESLQQEVNKLENIIDKKVDKNDADYLKIKTDLDEAKLDKDNILNTNQIKFLGWTGKQKLYFVL